MHAHMLALLVFFVSAPLLLYLALPAPDGVQARVILCMVLAAVAAVAVRDAVLEGGGELLRSAEVFDLYAGEQLGEGKVSLALRLEFRAPDRTLTDEEVGGLRERIKAKLEEIGGTLRE
jgi:phenylalanyl-tRNA synthetase beta chain